MIQNRQGIEMAGAADGHDPVTQRHFRAIRVCFQLCRWVSLTCDGELWRESRKNEAGMGTEGLG